MGSVSAGLLLSWVVAVFPAVAAKYPSPRAELATPKNSSKTTVEATFSISTSAEEVVLRLHDSAGMVPESSTIEVFGDGRITQLTSSADPGAARTREIRRTPAEIEALVRIAAEHGLLESSTEQLRSLLGTSSSTGILEIEHFQDAGETTLEIAIESYERAGAQRGPLHKTLKYQAPGGLHHLHPEVSEFAGLAEISKQLTSWIYGRRPGQPVPPP